MEGKSISAPMIEAKRDIFRDIEKRNTEIREQLQSQIEGFESKIITFLQFREKVDKIRVGYFLMTSKQERKKVKKITQETEEKLRKKTLSAANGDPKKAISLLTDPSFEI